MKLMFICLLLGVFFLGFGQQNTFKIRAYAPNYSYLSQIIQLNDGSYVGAGNIFYNSNDNSANPYLLKTNANGGVLASKAINISGDDYENNVTKTNDNGFIMCGSFNSQLGLIKFNADLSVQWKRNYLINNGYASAFKVLQTSDDGYFVVGSIDTINVDTYRGGGYILKVDKDGNVLFSKTYFNNVENHLFDIVATIDGNYALVFQSNDFEINDSVQLIKIKPDGNILWAENLYNNGAPLNSNSLIASSDGGLVMVGEIARPDISKNTYQMMMVKYSNTGDLIWSKSTGVSGNVEGYGFSVLEDKDAGYIFAGELDTYKKNGDYDTSYGYMAKTNASGALQWTKTFEANEDGFTGFNGIIPTLDGGYVTCGEVYIFNDSAQDYLDGSLIYKFNADLQTCDEMPASKGTIQNFGTNSTTSIIVNDVSTTAGDITTTLSNAGIIDNVCSTSVLPLQLLSFNATLQNKTVAVQWTTANEINTSYFVVERSNNPTTFAALQQVAAKGGNASYRITDLHPQSGTSYYRLKEVDNDGKITYSSVVPVTMLSNGAIIISPNPVQNAVRVVMQSEGNAKVTFKVVDLQGRILVVQNASVSTGKNAITIPSGLLSKGVYILKVTEGNATRTIRFVKE